MQVSKTIIIAEAGVNHNGDFNKARELIEVAADAGADYVKFQTFKANKIVDKSAKKAEYQLRNINDGNDSQYAMLKKLEMPEEWHFRLQEYAQSLGIAFLSTAFDEESVDFLESLNPDFYKIPSGEITNKPYLEHVAGKGKKLIMSTGMADIEEVGEAVNVLENAGLEKSKLTLLHCNSEYPTPMRDVNLFAMLHMQKELDVKVGYSDHTLGIEIPIAAVALGASVIEKHFTLSRNMPGPDHKASLEPKELKGMVTAIRNIELAISGSGEKKPSQSEKKNLQLSRKSIYYRNNLNKGHKVQTTDLIMLRPGNGVSPMNIDGIVGSTMLRNVKAFELLDINHLSLWK